MPLRISLLVIGALATFGCEGSFSTGPNSVVEPGEWLPGGAATNTLLLGRNAFLRPAPNLSAENRTAFYGGNSFFNQGWVEAPASTKNRDGLGPLFNAKSCSGCHFRDGKSAPPEEGTGPFVGLLLRLSVPGANGPEPDPVYGGQLQDQAIPDVPVEAMPSVKWFEEEGQFADGTPYTLVKPEFTVTDFSHGPFPDDIMISPRIAPHMIGLGLLEGIPLERLEELADPDDADQDGISGRIQWHEVDGEMVVGRFGWKGDASSVDIQVANAFSGDMGLTSELVPLDDCTDEQVLCVESLLGGEPEVEPHIFDRVVHYSRAIAVPVRRAADDPEVLKGKSLFHQVGCASCHTPSHTTGGAALEEFNDLLIWPYTDMLLHDMGPELEDGRPVGEASGREWRTAPLWGLGLMQDVSGHTRFLHDGRARNIGEAILWHGGEGDQARQAYLKLGADERAALIRFVEDL